MRNVSPFHPLVMMRARSVRANGEQGLQRPNIIQCYPSVFVQKTLSTGYQLLQKSQALCHGLLDSAHSTSKPKSEKRPTAQACGSVHHESQLLEKGSFVTALHALCIMTIFIATAPHTTAASLQLLHQSCQLTVSGGFSLNHLSFFYLSD